MLTQRLEAPMPYGYQVYRSQRVKMLRLTIGREGGMAIVDITVNRDITLSYTDGREELKLVMQE